MSVVCLLSIALITVAASDDRFVYPDDHHHHHHHHDSSSLSDFSDSAESVEPQQTEIPLEFIQSISNVSVSELLARFVDGKESGDGGVILEDRFGERDGSVTPKPATCAPELRTVSLGDPDPGVLLIPSCTRVERCGGCCSHVLLECRATESETVNFLVYKTQYIGSGKLSYIAKEVVQVERHTKCRCGCKIREEDCNVLQVYNEDVCRCVCRNKDEEKKCLKKSDAKLWDPESCACKCRNERPCSSGFYFDPATCKCVAPPMRRRYVTDTPTSVVPLQNKY